ncbi:endolytic transglycosylase MltG [Streptomyces sp. NPDC002343]
MQTNTPPRSTIRLTRRGRLLTIVAGAVAAGTAVAVPLLLLASDREQTRPATLVIPEGWRANQVYDAVDKALRLPPGSTRKSLGKAALRLPGEAEGNPEGYLFPATYPIPEGATPESLLRTMVDTANDKYGLAPVTAGAQRNAMNLHQAVTVASIVQAEAGSKADMGKIARVILNRLARGMPLQMDSTVSYALDHDPVQAGRSSGQVQSPYDSYSSMGLPPTPIDNPGADAMRAALNPTPGDWLYFVTVRPGDTRFTADYDEHLRNVAEFHAVHQSAAPASPDGGVPWSSPSPVPAQPSAG